MHHSEFQRDQVEQFHRYFNSFPSGSFGTHTPAPEALLPDSVQMSTPQQLMCSTRSAREAKLRGPRSQAGAWERDNETTTQRSPKPEQISTLRRVQRCELAAGCHCISFLPINEPPYNFEVPGRGTAIGFPSISNGILSSDFTDFILVMA